MSFVNLYKPAGVSSFRVLSVVKKLFNTKKVGHMGTLDPSASGVLPVAINSSTKLIQFFNNEEKEYVVTILFGYETDSYDLEKFDREEVLQSVMNDVCSCSVTLEKIDEFLVKNKGEIDQVPPIFSAIKINGVRAYKFARNKQISESDLESRKVCMKNSEILDFKWPLLKIKLRVSSGFYVRSFVRDLGVYLSCKTVMFDLVRSKVGPFLIENAHLPENLSPESLISPLNVMKEFPLIDISESDFKNIKNGIAIELSSVEPLVFLKYDGELVSVVKKDNNDCSLYKVYRNL